MRFIYISASWTMRTGSRKTLEEDELILEDAIS